MNRLIIGLAATLFAGSLHAACDRQSEPGIIAVGDDTGLVAVLDKCHPSRPVATFRPFGVIAPVNLAAADFGGDGEADLVVGPGPGGGPHVRVFSAAGVPLFELTPFPNFSGGVRVAVGDINNDGIPDIITGPGAGGGPHVRVFDGYSQRLLLDLALDPQDFAGGVFVASGDVNGDGRADIIVGAGPGGGPHVRVFSSLGEPLRSFIPYQPAFSGGVRVAAGDVNGDGRVDIITGPGAGGGPHIKVFDGVSSSEVLSFFAFPLEFMGGVFVAGAADDGGQVMVAAGASTGGIATVRVFGPDAQVQWLMPFPGYEGGLTLATSAGAMGDTPARKRLPGGLKITSTW